LEIGTITQVVFLPIGHVPKNRKLMTKERQKEKGKRKKEKV